MPDKRLIDANALMKNIGKIPQLRGITYGRMKKAVEETPTIDAVEVVRCMDCAGRKKNKFCIEWLKYVPDDGFCHKGAKMDGGADK